MVTVILDTNIWISAIFFKGKLTTIFEGWKNNQFTIVFSNETFAELKEKLLFWGEKLGQKVFVTEYLLLIHKNAIFYYPKNHFTICEDPTDNKFFDLALESNANYLVSGDKVVQQASYQGTTKILSPSAFIKILTKTH